MTLLYIRAKVSEEPAASIFREEERKGPKRETLGSYLVPVTFVSGPIIFVYNHKYIWDQPKLINKKIDRKYKNSLQNESTMIMTCWCCPPTSGLMVPCRRLVWQLFTNVSEKHTAFSNADGNLKTYSPVMFIDVSDERSAAIFMTDDNIFSLLDVN